MDWKKSVCYGFLWWIILALVSCGDGTVKPDEKLAKKADEMKTIDSGKLVSCKIKNGVITARYEKLLLTIESVNNGVFHIKATFSNELPQKHSYAVVESQSLKSLEFKEAGAFFTAKNVDKALKIDKSSASIEYLDNQGVICSFRIGMQTNLKETRLAVIADYRGERFFGLGEKTGDFELTGRDFTMYNADTYKYDYKTDPIYASIPFYLAFSKDAEYGVFFDSPARSFFSFKSNDYRYSTRDNHLDFYLFSGSPKQIIGDYTTLTGKPYLPPIWGFGYHQSRYTYMTEGEVMGVASNLVNNQIPTDVIYLDIDFMSNRMAFTHNSSNFPFPKKMMENLLKMGIRTVAIVDPGIKTDTNYWVYQSGLENDVFLKYKGKEFHGTVWPGMCAFPDYTKEKTRVWWGELYRYLTDMGIAGFWNDMNEPSVFSTGTMTLPDMVEQDYEGIGAYHKDLHNVYGMTMVMATHLGLTNIFPNKRPFILTRAAYAGIQRFSFLWTGDNTANWDHLKMNLYMVMNIGLSGIPYSGADIGGYTGAPSEELFTRWNQLAAFIPFMRNHTEQGTKYQEPYIFTNNLPIIRKYIQLRYKLLPYLYTAVYQANRTGLPIVRPLFLDYGRDYLQVCNQFLFGESILVVPVLEAAAKTVRVVIPEGTWVDYHSGKAYEKGEYTLDVTIQDIPVFIKAGSIIPTYDFAMKSTLDLDKDGVAVTWKVYPDREGRARGVIYQDDGDTTDYQQGAYSIIRLDYQTIEKIPDIQMTEEGIWDKSRRMIIEFPKGSVKATVNGEEIELENGRYERSVP